MLKYSNKKTVQNIFFPKKPTKDRTRKNSGLTIKSSDFIWLKIMINKMEKVLKWSSSSVFTIEKFLYSYQNFNKKKREALKKFQELFDELIIIKNLLKRYRILLEF